MANPMKVKRMQTRLFSASSDEVRKEAALSFLVLGPILQKPKMEQRGQALLYETKGSGCDLFIAATILAELGDKKRSVDLLERAATKGSPAAGMQLGAHFLEKHDFKAAMKWYRKSADLGNPIAAHKLAALYDFEAPGKRDLASAVSACFSFC